MPGADTIARIKAPAICATPDKKKDRQTGPKEPADACKLDRHPGHSQPATLNRRLLNV